MFGARFFSACGVYNYLGLGLLIGWMGVFTCLKNWSPLSMLSFGTYLLLSLPVVGPFSFRKNRGGPIWPPATTGRVINGWIGARTFPPLMDSPFPCDPRFWEPFERPYPLIESWYIFASSGRSRTHFVCPPSGEHLPWKLVLLSIFFVFDAFYSNFFRC